ncbi:MAG: ABC transporter permease [Planctomycetes bacterium]|nr:ABC transporter permease [Planctomycetota bacterium]
MKAAREFPAALRGSLYRVGVLFRRELGAFLVSPGVYIILFFVFALQVGLFWAFFTFGRGDVRGMIGIFYNNVFFYLIMFFMPAVVTMRLFAEEKKKGTLEMLFAAPVADLEVVLSKYLAAFAMMLVVWLPSALFFWMFATKATGTPDWAPLYSSLAGVALMCALLVSIGLFSSALADDPLVAAVLTFMLTLVFFGMFFLRSIASDPSQTHALRIYNPVEQFGSDFTQGVIDTRVVFFYLTCTAVFLFGTHKLTEVRRWQ